MAVFETLTERDWMQLLREVHSEDGKSIRTDSKIMPYNADYLAITRILAGAAIGEMSTIVYKQGGAGGTTVATMTMTYDIAGDLLTATVT